MRRYETIFITHPELTEEELSQLKEKILSILNQFKGDLIKLDDWGVKKLTFEIRKNSRGRFFLMDYAAGKDLIRELERNLRLNDRVLRFQTVRTSEEVTPEAIKTLKESASVEKPKASERIEPPPSAKVAQAPPAEGGEKE
ncbi:MAG: 30S ribosomal protein S6 [Syntrophaceae bacterium]|nr:30S ribosomal protein S6 [Syntrophaceae bacterium]